MRDERMVNKFRMNKFKKYKREDDERVNIIDKNIIKSISKRREMKEREVFILKKEG